VDILIAHHRTHQLDRCIKVRGLHVCARCAALYPAMALGLWAALAHPAAPVTRAELGARLALSVVGVAAWGVEHVRPLRFRGANAVRMGFGALLGLALGVMLGRHFVEPYRPDVVGQIVVISVLAGAFVLVDLLARRTVRKGRDREETSPLGDGEPSP